MTSAWLLSRTLNGAQVENEDEQARVPEWSAYNSLVSEALSVTHVAHHLWWHILHMNGTRY